MRSAALSVTAAFLAAGTALAAGTEEAQFNPQHNTQPDIQLIDAPQFIYERFRKGPHGEFNWVRGYLTVEAAPGVALQNVRAHVDYVDYAGKTLISAGPKTIGDMKGGEVRETELSRFTVPRFNGYAITVRCAWRGREREFKFYGSRTTAAPFHIPRKPYPRAVQPVMMAHELDPDVRGRGANLYVRVRNLGAVTTRKLHATIQLLDRKGRPRRGRNMKGRTLLSGARGGRNGEVAGGEERLFTVRFAAFPAFENYSVKLDWEKPSADELLSGGEFTGGPEVELAHFKFTRKGEGKDAGALEISGEARNGLSEDIRDLRITLALRLKPQKGTGPGRPKPVKTMEHTVPGVIRAGETKRFTITAGDAGKYNDFDYKLAYGEAAEAETIAGAPGGQPVVTVREAVMKGGKTLVVTGDVRNATSTPLRDFRLTFHLNRDSGGGRETVADITHEVPGVIQPGETVPFSVSKEDCPAFDQYLFETSFLPAQ